MGGKAPVIVFEDALEDAVKGAAFAAFIACGQVCVQGSRILIHESVHDKFIDLFKEKIKGLIIGNPQDPETQIGPVITGIISL